MFFRVTFGITATLVAASLRLALAQTPTMDNACQAQVQDMVKQLGTDLAAEQLFQIPATFPTDLQIKTVGKEVQAVVTKLGLYRRNYDLSLTQISQLDVHIRELGKTIAQLQQQVEKATPPAENPPQAAH